IALQPVLPPNLVWLCYLMPVVLVSVSWGFGERGRRFRSRISRSMANLAHDHPGRGRRAPDEHPNRRLSDRPNLARGYQGRGRASEFAAGQRILGLLSDLPPNVTK